MTSREKNKILDMVRAMTVQARGPKTNSEYHLGFNDARGEYAEQKLILIKQIELM